MMDQLYLDNFMNHTSYSSPGPKCFGTSKRNSFVDVRDDDIPGPGSHNSSRIDKTTPVKWKFGTSTQRDTFLEKHPRANPSPNHYSPNPEPTLTTHPLYSFPKASAENPAGFKEDENSRLDYKPTNKLTKSEAPSYGFGYFQEHDYSTKVPAPNAYKIKKGLEDRSRFNKTQSFFYSADRPLPYGDWGANPGIGEYNINHHDPMRATCYKFAHAEKLPDPKVEGIIPTKYYDIGKEMRQSGKGPSIIPFYEAVKNKDLETFPAANHYNPRFIQSRKKIVTFTSKRSELYEKDHIRNPSPQKHVTSPEFYKTKKSLSFTKEPRYEHRALEGPGPAKYNMERKLNSEKGYMGRKIKKLPEFITPAGSNYQPVEVLTKPTPQRVINYETNRVDFSKSITGVVGPGDYDINKDATRQLGKMSKSLKFEKNRNRNPGPGFYDIPTSIGQLPKYYCGQKKLTTTGYSTFALQMQEKTKRHEQWVLEQEKEKEREEEKKRMMIEEQDRERERKKEKEMEKAKQAKQAKQHQNENK